MPSSQGTTDRENRATLSANDQVELNKFKELLFGRTINRVVFNNWAHGFEFSQYEASALVQHTGGELNRSFSIRMTKYLIAGPCSVIATCQAFILKHLMDLPGKIFNFAINCEISHLFMFQAHSLKI